MSAIEASTYTVRTLVDGTLSMTVHIEPRHAQAAFALLGAPGTSLALAALKAPQEKPKGGEASKWLAMRCQEPAFQAWIAKEFSILWAALNGTQDDQRAAHAVRRLLGIESRAEIDNDDAVREKFDRLIRRPWMAAEKA